jgi:tRNA(fMet)-specific endonuclease VapC
LDINANRDTHAFPLFPSLPLLLARLSCAPKFAPLPPLRRQNSICKNTFVRHELYVGIALAGDGENKKRQPDEFLSPIPCLPFDDKAAFHAADIRADLTRKGNLIGPNDLLIAGHARSLGLKLITGNLREFSRVDGLRCEDWLAE